MSVLFKYAAALKKSTKQIIAWSVSGSLGSLTAAIKSEMNFFCYYSVNKKTLKFSLPSFYDHLFDFFDLAA